MRCSPVVRNSPLKSSCFSSENHDHCQTPGRSCFMVTARVSRLSRFSRVSDLMLSGCQEQSVEVELLLIREPRPLPDSGEKLFHGNSPRFSPFPLFPRLRSDALRLSGTVR